MGEARAVSPVGYVGLGHLGAPMARRLLATGHDVVGFDVRPEAVTALLAHGGASVAGVGEMTARCQIVMVCVTDGGQVRQTVDALLEATTEDSALRTILVHSTVTPELVIDLDSAARTAGVRVVDATVSGNDEMREQGLLSMMVGAREGELPSEALDAVEACASHIVYGGSVGTGAALKLINNALSVTTLMAVADALRLAEALGIPLEVVREVTAHSSGDSWTIRNLEWCLSLPKNHPQGGDDRLYGVFMKDLTQAVSTGTKAGIDMPFIQSAVDVGRVALDALYHLPPAPRDPEPVTRESRVCGEPAHASADR